MHNRFIFGDKGSDPARPLARDAAIALYAITLLISCLAWGYAVDHSDEAQDAYAAGLAVGRQQMAEVVGDAYRQGELAAQAALCPAQAAQSQQRVAP